MDSPPPSPLAATPPSRRSEARLRTKPSAPYIVHLADNGGENNCGEEHNCSNLTPPKLLKNRSPISPSPLHLSIHAAAAADLDHIPLRELLLLPPSPARRSKPRRIQMEMENIDPDATPRRRSKNRSNNMGLMGCASPRNGRRSRRRLDKESIREEKEPGLFEEDVGKVRKRRQSSRPAAARKEKPVTVAPVHTSSPSPNIVNSGNQSGLEGVWGLVSELVMWENVAKSSLWFGIGSLCFLSSCFSRKISFNFISAISHVGLFILALAFFYDSFSRRCEERKRRKIELNEDDIVRAVRIVLPTANAAIAMAQDVFSGEPSMTLRVAPVLLFAAKYGHLITLRRLCATGFYFSFTVPKLYSRYSQQIQKHVMSMNLRVSEAWKTCNHKRAIALSVGTVFWNTFGVKTRILAAFIAVVLVQYRRQHGEGEQVAVEESRDEVVQEQATVAPGEEQMGTGSGV